jgi:FecR-like protein
MKTLAASLVLMSLAVSAAAQEPAVDYRFDQVKRKVVLTTSTQELRVQKGQHAQSGDKIQTGIFSYALIASDQHRARFEIFSSTDVKLAAGTPGLILSLERGRLRALFDKITGNEPRVVQTPGALLAVRGTQYDAEVDVSGRTTVDVWEGVVEIRSTMLPQPLLVSAGQESTFGRRETPTARPMPEERRRNAPALRGQSDGHRPDPRGDDHHGDPRGTEPTGGAHDHPPQGSPHGGPAHPPSKPPAS